MELDQRSHVLEHLQDVFQVTSFKLQEYPELLYAGLPMYIIWMRNGFSSGRGNVAVIIPLHVIFRPTPLVEQSQSSSSGSSNGGTELVGKFVQVEDANSIIPGFKHSENSHTQTDVRRPQIEPV